MQQLRPLPNPKKDIIKDVNELDENDCDVLSCVLYGLKQPNYSFENKNLVIVDFNKCVLKGLSFKSTRLLNVEFLGCDLTKCNFDKAYLSDVTFKYCKLDFWDFRYSYLSSVEFIDCESNGEKINFENNCPFKKSRESLEVEIINSGFLPSRQEARKIITAYILENYSKKTIKLSHHKPWVRDLSSIIFKYYFWGCPL